MHLGRASTSVVAGTNAATSGGQGSTPADPVHPPGSGVEERTLPELRRRRGEAEGGGEIIARSDLPGHTQAAMSGTNVSQPGACLP